MDELAGCVSKKCLFRDSVKVPCFVLGEWVSERVNIWMGEVPVNGWVSEY